MRSHQYHSTKTISKIEILHFYLYLCLFCDSKELKQRENPYLLGNSHYLDVMPALSGASVLCTQ